MTTLRLFVLLVRRGGWRGLAVPALSAVGVAAATALGLVALAFAPAFDARADRIAWRVADPVAIEGAAAVLRTERTTFAGREIAVVRLEAVPGVDLPVPPGLRHAPQAGEVVLSPALVDLAGRHPDGELADRFPGTVIGRIGAAGLAHADELAAVVGVAPGTLEPDPESDVGPAYLAPGVGVPVAGYALVGDDTELLGYRTLAQIAAALLVVPTVVLVGASARLAAARREQRLSVLRLAGAPPRAVVALTALETGLAGLLGAALGLVVHLAALPVVAGVELAGGPFPVGDLVLPATTLALALVVVPVLAALSAAVAPRRVTIGPLGVARRVRGRRPHPARLLAVALVVAGLAVLGAGGGAPLLAVVAAVVGVAAMLTVVGPWLTWCLGAATVRLARRPSTLLAGRRIVDDPGGAHRSVSGMVLAGFVAGVILGVLPTVHANELPGADERTVVVDLAPAAPALLRSAVLEREPGAVVDLTREVGGAGGVASYGEVRATSAAGAERVRTALLLAAPGAQLDRDARTVGGLATLDADVELGAGALALAAVAMAATSAAIATTASVLDQRPTLARLRLLGTPLVVLQRARRWQVVLPLVAVTAGSLVAGAGLGRALLSVLEVNAVRLRPPALGPMALVVLASVLAGLAVVGATAPVLRAAVRSTPGER